MFCTLRTARVNVVSEIGMFRKRYKTIIILLYLCFDYVHQYQIANVENEPENHYDFLIFSQFWPGTLCKMWMEQDPQNNCTFPIKSDRWTIHGIWPSRSIDLGPEFCKDSWPFDIKEIESIVSDLEQAWTNVFEGSDPYSLWSHEWDKHGTCGIDLEYLDTPIKYFNKGIELNMEYSLSDMLSDAGIFPSDKELTAEELGSAVMAKTGKQPKIGCYTINGVQYIQDLRICFDKNLNKIDCSSLVTKTCDVSKGIIYPSLS